MKTIKLLGLLALMASSVASANSVITFPGESSSVSNTNFPNVLKSNHFNAYHQRWDFPLK